MSNRSSVYWNELSGRPTDTLKFLLQQMAQLSADTAMWTSKRSGEEWK